MTCVDSVMVMPEQVEMIMVVLRTSTVFALVFAGHFLGAGMISGYSSYKQSR
jgi:hypothetical protein